MPRRPGEPARQPLRCRVVELADAPQSPSASGPGFLVAHGEGRADRAEEAGSIWTPSTIGSLPLEHGATTDHSRWRPLPTRPLPRHPREAIPPLRPVDHRSSTRPGGLRRPFSSPSVTTGTPRQDLDPRLATRASSVGDSSACRKPSSSPRSTRHQLNINLIIINAYDGVALLHQHFRAQQIDPRNLYGRAFRWKAAEPGLSLPVTWSHLSRAASNIPPVVPGHWRPASYTPDRCPVRHGLVEHYRGQPTPHPEVRDRNGIRGPGIPRRSDGTR